MPPVTAIRPNAFKRALADGRRQIGLWSSLCSPLVAEVLGGSGFDWILLDMEHSPNELPVVMGQLQAMMESSAEPVVRIPWNDAVLFKRFLDIGARSLLVPMVQSAEEARQAVSAMRYPPGGIRGVSVSNRANRYGRLKSYFKDVEADLCLLVQVETRAAMAELAAILEVDGVDGVFVGPSDLSADFGQLGNPGHPDVQAAIESAGRTIRAAGKAAGILAPVEADARRYLTWGYNFVAVGSDVGLLARHADALAASFAEASS